MGLIYKVAGRRNNRVGMAGLMAQLMVIDDFITTTDVSTQNLMDFIRDQMWRRYRKSYNTCHIITITSKFTTLFIGGIV